MKRIIFLHIEKAAGTAIRDGFFLKNIRSEYNWEGMSCGSLQDSVFLGGHRHVNFYIDNCVAENSVFFSILREPVSRVISLYNYYKSRNKLPGMMNELCINRTILENELFREQIRNSQNRYLSGSESFEETKKFIGQNSFLIGCQDNVDKFKDFVSFKLGFKINGKVSGNSGDRGYKNNLKLTPEAYQELVGLTYEDIKLFNFLKTKNSELINTISEDDWKKLRESITDHFPKEDVFVGRAEIINKIKPVKNNSRFSIFVKIENHSGTDWIDKNDSRICFSYHWLNADNSMHKFEGVRTLVKKSIRDGEVVFGSMDILTPDKPGVYLLEATGVKEGKAWFEDHGFRVDRLVCKVL